METTKKTTFVAGAAILAFAGVLCKIIGVMIRIWAYDVIGEAGMVYYEIVFPFYSWLLIISSSGVPTAISRMVSERFGLGDFAGARRVFRHALVLLAAVGLLTTAVLYFGARFFAITLLEKDETYILSFTTLAPALFFVSCMCAYRGYLQGAQHMTGTGISQLTEQVVKAIAGLYLASRWISRGPEYGAAGLLLGVTISEFVALLVVMAFRYKNRRLYMPLGASTQPRNDNPVIPELLKIAIPITLGASIIPITSMLDVKMIFSGLGRYMAEADVNQRYVALSTNVRSLINLPASLTTALAMSIVPAISRARAKGDVAATHRFAGLGLKLSMAIGMPCAVGLFVLGGPIIQMLFRSITPQSLAVATQIMHVAAWTVVFISLVQTMTGALQGMGKQSWPVFSLLAGGAAKILSNLVLLSIPKVNILGASFSNLICYAVSGIIDTVLVLRVTGLRIRFVDMFLKPIACSLAMGAAVYGAYALLYAIRPGIITTLASVLVGVGVYLFMAMVMRLFTPEELSSIPGGSKLKRFFK
ncbi:MAG: polysaccharide biosynthesis protein [Clostridia bacterium]|nr:polysaccharide biosynthesis protein [Clostridia bacterium]